MNLKKLGWILKILPGRICDWIRYAYYRLRFRWAKDGDSRTYYGYRFSLARPLPWKELEEEYRSTFEPETLQEDDTEETVEQTGLLRSLSLIELAVKSIELSDRVYVLTQVDEYEDRIRIALSKFVGGESTEEVLEIPREGATDKVAFNMDGLRWFWDMKDDTLRVIPSYDATVTYEAVPGVSLLDKAVLRVEKTLAEEKLSGLCRQYAFAVGEAGYDWCIADRSFCTVVEEMPDPFVRADAENFEQVKERLRQENYQQLCFYCRTYCAERAAKEAPEAESEATAAEAEPCGIVTNVT